MFADPTNQGPDRTLWSYKYVMLLMSMFRRYTPRHKTILNQLQNIHRQSILQVQWLIGSSREVTLQPGDQFFHLLEGCELGMITYLSFTKVFQISQSTSNIKTHLNTQHPDLFCIQFNKPMGWANCPHRGPIMESQNRCGSGRIRIVMARGYSSRG